MSKKYPVTPTQFINVLVTAIPHLDPKTGKTVYTTTFMPEALRVVQPDTVINYQLVGPTPAGVRFAAVTVTPDGTQFSTPSISRSGKIVTFSDANTAAETLHITLHFTDSDGIGFDVDPEVTNDPQPTLARAAALDGEGVRLAFMPEQGNDPQPVKLA